MARTFTPLIGSLVANDFRVGDKFGYQHAEEIRQAIDIALYLAGHLDLGGSNVTGISSATYVPVVGYRDYALDGSMLGGLTWEAVAYYRTTAAATAVTARIRNTTAGSTVGTGTTSVATTLTKEVITLALGSVVGNYQLEVTGNNALNPVYAYGYLRLRRVPV